MQQNIVIQLNLDIFGTIDIFSYCNLLGWSDSKWLHRDRHTHIRTHGWLQWIMESVPVVVHTINHSVSCACVQYESTGRD